MKNVVKICMQMALPLLGSAFLLWSCDNGDAVPAVNEETLMTEESENLSIVMSENGRKSYFFKTPLLEGYTLARDPYREFRKGIDITTYQDDSMSTVNANLTANYAIYYENRKLWEAKGDVVVIKADGTELYTQQLFWNSMTKRIYSNVDTKIVKGTDVFMGEGFESDEELKHWKFRRMTGRMFVKIVPGEEDEEGAEGEDGEEASGDEKPADEPVVKPANERSRSVAKLPDDRPNGGENRRQQPRRQEQPDLRRPERGGAREQGGSREQTGRREPERSAEGRASSRMQMDRVRMSELEDIKADDAAEPSGRIAE